MRSTLIPLGQLIDDSWELYKSRFHELMNVSSWLLILAILYVISLSLYPSASALWNAAELSGLAQTGVILFIITSYIVSPIIGTIVLIGLTRLIRSHVAGRGGNLKSLAKEIKPLFLPTLFVNILVGCYLLLAILIGFGPTIILNILGAIFGNTLLVAIGGILLVFGTFVALVLAFCWMIEYMLAPYIMILDGVRGRKALMASRKLVKGRFWHAFFRLVVPKIVFIIFGVLLMAIVSYFVEIILDVTGGMNLDLSLRIKTLIEWVMPVVITVLINPLMIISDLLLLQALKDNPS